MNACFMNNPYHRIVPQTAPVIDVTYLELKFIVKLVRRLFLKFDALHAQVLQQFLFARQGYASEKFPPLCSQEPAFVEPIISPVLPVNFSLK